jgi:hypothetical protein
MHEKAALLCVELNWVTLSLGHLWDVNTKWLMYGDAMTSDKSVRMQCSHTCPPRVSESPLVCTENIPAGHSSLRCKVASQYSKFSKIRSTPPPTPTPKIVLILVLEDNFLCVFHRYTVRWNRRLSSCHGWRNCTRLVWGRGWPGDLTRSPTGSRPPGAPNHRHRRGTSRNGSSSSREEVQGTMVQSRPLEDQSLVYHLICCL